MVTEYIGGSAEDFAALEDIYERENMRHATSETARNFVNAMSKTPPRGFVAKPWFPKLYRHTYRYDTYPVVVTRNFKPWNLKNFHPTKSWSARAEGQYVIISFRSEEDFFLFKLAVL